MSANLLIGLYRLSILQISIWIIISVYTSVVCHVHNFLYYNKNLNITFIWLHTVIVRMFVYYVGNFNTMGLNAVPN